MNYRHLPGLTPDGTVYINDRLNTLEAIIPPGPFQSAHAPSLLELPDGDLLCAWFAGSFEGNTDVRIVCARLPKNSDCWENPVKISDDPGRSDQNPSLFLTPGGIVWAMYTSQLGRVPGKDNMQFTSVICCRKSYDAGRTWGKCEVMFPEEGTFARQPIQILKSGRWIYGNWICRESPDGLAADPSAFRISDDCGKSWRKTDMPESRGCVHPNIVELTPGHLVAFMRSRKADFIYRSESADNGDTWEKPVPTALPNNNSGISAIRLKSGRIAIACNPTSDPEAAKNGAAWPGLRCPVAVALSEDGGKNFPLIRNMESGEGYVGKENRCNNRQYEYPFLMQTQDGMLHLAFSCHDRAYIKWMSFSEQDVIGKSRGEKIYNPTSSFTNL